MEKESIAKQLKKNNLIHHPCACETLNDSAKFWAECFPSLANDNRSIDDIILMVKERMICTKNLCGSPKLSELHKETHSEFINKADYHFMSELLYFLQKLKEVQ